MVVQCEGGSCDLIVLHKLSSWVEVRLHAKISSMDTHALVKHPTPYPPPPQKKKKKKKKNGPKKKNFKAGKTGKICPKKKKNSPKNQLFFGKKKNYTQKIFLL